MIIKFLITFCLTGAIIFAILLTGKYVVHIICGIALLCIWEIVWDIVNFIMEESNDYRE